MNSVHATVALGGTMAVMIAGAVSGSVAVPRPEHPRPDLFRENWMTLNGEWQFEIDSAADGVSRGLIGGRDLNARIIVPFCPESKLSGLGLGNSRRLKDVWYRRTFEVPPAMEDKRIRLHFGGVDYQAWVYINGQFAGTHKGESAAFSFDITPMLVKGANEVVVKVRDDMWSGLQPLGKQSPDQSGGCIYTRLTGIWQSVWLEAVGSSFIESISVVPDPDHARVRIAATIDGMDQDLTLKAEAFAGGKRVGSATAKHVSRDEGPHLELDLKEKRLWEPGSPFLYDLALTLYRGRKKVDELKSYFGLRKVTIEGYRILINDKPVFQRLILDQGYYPDGNWTAPSDQALKQDIELSMACGYSGARLHQKVFEPRFLYWADTLGYLIWGEYPNWGYNNSPEGHEAFLNEWTEILRRDRNHPSIIGWCPFNESAGSAAELQKKVWEVTKAMDPTRPTLETSGWSHTIPNPEVLDAHDYDGNPETLRRRWMDHFSLATEVAGMPARYRSGPATRRDHGLPFMISEIGGIGWATQGGWSYGAGPGTLDEFYVRYQGTIDAMLDNPRLFGFCYTQLTDIEQEQNGLYFYDRTPKFDVEKLREITSRRAAYEDAAASAPVVAGPGNTWRVILGAVQDGTLSTPYAYTTEAPPGDWMNQGFDDSSWPTGLAPFGRERNRDIKTAWTTADIYLRKTFDFDGGDFTNGALVICHDEDTDVYVNGLKIRGFGGYVTRYQLHMVTDALRKSLRKGRNTLAVHTHQTTGGQYIDLAILVDQP